jgi:hypothetical protein
LESYKTQNIISSSWMDEPPNLIYRNSLVSVQSVLDLLELVLGKTAEQDAGRAHRDGVAGVVVTSDDSSQVHARSRHILNKETFKVVSVTASQHCLIYQGFAYHRRGGQS